MLLYLVRHAIAAPADAAIWPDDGTRPLTKRGKKRFRRAAAGLRAFAPAPERVLSSPLARAWQTAELLEQAAGWPGPVCCEALVPGRPAHDVLAALQPHAGIAVLAIVGHEPILGELAALLLWGQAQGAPVAFRKGGVACLELEGSPQDRGAHLIWHATPRLLRAIGRAKQRTRA